MTSKVLVIHVEGHPSPETKRALVSQLEAKLGPAFKVIVLDASVKSFELVNA